jgi:phosphoserine aminotransferase
MQSMGGVEAMEARNQRKAELIYREIDRNELFEGHALIESRSTMNATFKLKDDTHADAFDTLWKEAGINGLKGHRSVGGYRASMYNALSEASVQVLVDTMQELERTR